MSHTDLGQSSPGRRRNGRPNDVGGGQLGSAGRQAAGAARRAGNSPWLDRLARVGLAARGLVYILIGVLALQIAFAGKPTHADQKGAFQTLASQGWGKAVLWVVILGFLGYAAWQATEAVGGYLGETDDRKRLMKRVESAVKAVLYVLLAIAAFRVVMGSSSSSRGGETFTAKVLKMTGGQFLVGLAGVVIVAVALVLTWRGLRTEFEKHLNLASLSPMARSAVINLGKVGYIARGVVFTIIGILVISAAVTFDPKKARGFDAALRELASRPFGLWLLAAVAIGLICFGAYSFAESRYRRL